MVEPFTLPPKVYIKYLNKVFQKKVSSFTEKNKKIKKKSNYFAISFQLFFSYAITNLEIKNDFISKK